MGNNINTFNELLRRLTVNSSNMLSMINAQQLALTTNDTFTAYDYENLANGEKKTYQITSLDAIVKLLKAVQTTLQNLSTGKATVTTTNGVRRQLKLSNLPKTPGRITGLSDPTTFDLDTNWFFEDLMFPGVTVNIDLTGQIDDTSDRVRVIRIILDATDTASQAIWQNNLSTNNYDLMSLKALLSYNNISYSQDELTIELPLVSNTLSGTFQVIDDPEIINGNTWYTLNTLTYATIDRNGTNQGNNNVLSVGDRLAYNDSLFQILEIDSNALKVRLLILSGAAFPGAYANFAYYQDPFRIKSIDVRFGAHEYNFIYIKGVNEDFNLMANEWSTPVKFASDDLVKSDDNNVKFDSFYLDNIVDWGALWIAEAKERNISAYNGHIPNAPTLNTGDLRVVQINTQINAAMETSDIKSTAAEIEAAKSQIRSLKQTISALQTQLQSLTNADEYNAMQQQISTNTADLKNLEASYSTLVNDFLSAVAENSAVIENPKYHIRGFFPIPEYKYRDEAGIYPEHIIGFDIAYRYICEDNTATLLNTFTFNDGTSTVTGTFTDWIVEQSKLKQRVWNSLSGMYEWQSENVADGTEVNINQIDIAITKGEKVEIKVRSISEAGYPNNPLKSAWSDSIIVEFPANLSTKNAMADLVQEINDDALNIAINNNLDSIGVTTHLDDTIANTNSVNGLYYKHVADNIAYEENDEISNSITSVSLQEKVSDMESRLKLIETYLTNMISEING